MWEFGKYVLWFMVFYNKLIFKIIDRILKGIFRFFFIYVRFNIFKDYKVCNFYSFYIWEFFWEMYYVFF